LYYTAVLHENLKLVNQFEFDAIWGANPKDNSYGDIGADAVAIEVKNTYADFNVGAFNFKVGTQGARKLGKGILFADDNTGILATYKGAGFTLPIYYFRQYEGYQGKDQDDFDADFYAIAPTFKAGSFKIQPILAYFTTNDYSGLNWRLGNVKDLDITYLGVEASGKAGPASVWVTLLYETGDCTDIATLIDYDMKGYAAHAGGNMKFGPGDIHAEILMLTGDDNNADTDWEQWFAPKFQSYYWAEIMGMGTFDVQASANSPGSDVTNLMAQNIGVTFKLAPKWKASLDLWHATLAEDDANGEDELGTEIDLEINYKVMKNLNLDLVAAYLSVGDATYKGPNQEDVTELAAQLSLKF
jgi:hypothetical protein